jgi:Cu/Ag efflux protein CusF
MKFSRNLTSKAWVFLLMLPMLFYAFALHAQETGAMATSDTAVAVDVITDIDKDTRAITLKDPVSGEKWIFNAGPEVKNFDQLKRGDLVLTEYYEGLAVALGPKGSGLKDRVTKTDVETAEPGEKPGVSITQATYIAAVVKAVDVEAGTVTLEGPAATLTLAAGDNVDLAKVEVGQDVEALYIQSYAISVEPAPKVSGTVKINMKAVALGVGYEWGKGTFTMYDGTEHEFQIRGLTLLDVGMSSIDLEGEVFHLVETSDLEGVYYAGQAGAALVGGGSALAMKNGNDVVLELRSSQEGVRLTLAAEGMRIKLK